MKRRTLLRSLASIPAAAAVPIESFSQQKDEKTAVREKGVPAGPPLVAPGTAEMPTTPVVSADTAAEMLRLTFSADQFSALSKFCDLVAPSRDEIPGAREGEVAEFLDFLIGESPAKTVQLYRQGLDELNAEAHTRYGKTFCEISAVDAKPILAALDEPWRFDDPDQTLAKFLRMARGDVIRATFNSRSYIDAISQTRRSRQGSGLYWYPFQ